MILGLSAATLALCSATAWADPPGAAKAAAKQENPVIVDLPPIHGFNPPIHPVDISKVPIKVPLPALRKPFVDRIAAAVEKDPF
jgi:hypothetical protein